MWNRLLASETVVEKSEIVEATKIGMLISCSTNIEYLF